MNAITRLFIGACCLVSHAVKAQTDQATPAWNRFAVQTGLNYSLTAVHLPPSARLLGLSNKIGYYIEGQYCRLWPSGFMLQMATGFQQKGVSAANPLNRSIINARYTYVSLTPYIGFEPVKRVFLLAGPQLNRLIGTQQPMGNASIIEFGVAAKIACQVKEIYINLGYFGSLIPYDHLEPIRATLYNQNWSIGLSRYMR